MKSLKILVFALFCQLYASALVAQPEILNIRQRQDSVGLFEKFEIDLSIKATYVNPFDPNEVDIITTFKSPSGKEWRIPGFYDYAQGMYWKVRFSPQETGVYQYSIDVRDKTGNVTSPMKEFKGTNSSRNGPLTIAQNKRYLEHSNGKKFFGVGFWYNDNYAGFNSGRVTAANLDELKKLGVNFISTYITPLETIGSGLGRYDQNICGRLDQLFEMLEERDMVLSLNLWFHSYLSETVWGGGNIRWYTNPYQQICAAKDFYRSTEAWKYQENLYRYFIARWGYSRSLAMWFVVDEVNGTDGWVSGDSLGAAKWAGQVHDYFKKNDPYNHPTTGTRSGGIKEYWHEGYQTFDIAAREIYEAQGFPITKSASLDSADIHPLTHSYTNYANQISRIWKSYEKPVIIGETGWDHTFYEPDMPGYLALYHNALWVSLATGSAMSPFWWAYSDRMNDNIVSKQLLSLRRFTDEIPVNRLTNVNPMSVSISGGHGFAVKSNELTFGWVVNSKTDVAGDSIQVEGLIPGKYKLRLYHTWRGAFIDEKELDLPEGSVSINLPYLHTSGSHANYTGSDMAFILEKVAPPPLEAGVSKRKTRKRT